LAKAATALDMCTGRCVPRLVLETTRNRAEITGVLSPRNIYPVTMTQGIGRFCICIVCGARAEGKALERFNALTAEEYAAFYSPRPPAKKKQPAANKTRPSLDDDDDDDDGDNKNNGVDVGGSADSLACDCAEEGDEEDDEDGWVEGDEDDQVAPRAEYAARGSNGTSQ
jgi:hypothetical protein